MRRTAAYGPQSICRSRERVSRRVIRKSGKETVSSAEKRGHRSACVATECCRDRVRDLVRKMASDNEMLATLSSAPSRGECGAVARMNRVERRRPVARLGNDSRWTAGGGEADRRTTVETAQIRPEFRQIESRHRTGRKRLRDIYPEREACLGRPRSANLLASTGPQTPALICARSTGHVWTGKREDSVSTGSCGVEMTDNNNDNMSIVNRWNLQFGFKFARTGVPPWGRRTVINDTVRGPG